jgi:CDP-diacylglycerol pyrophosphatase
LPEVLSEDRGLAINSRFGRSQDQLHIHISGVSPSVKDKLFHVSPPIEKE